MMSLLSIGVQSVITVGSMGASFLVSSDKPWRKWGYLLGFAIQPLWVYTYATNGQWALLPLTAWFTFSWTFGLYNFVIKPRKKCSLPDGVKLYRKKLLQPMRPYFPGEDLTGISVNKEDTPELGGMIAVNPDNGEDRWYVAKKFFEDNYEEVQ